MKNGELSTIETNLFPHIVPEPTTLSEGDLGICLRALAISTIRTSVFETKSPFLAKVRQNFFFLMLGGYAILITLWYAHNGVLFQFSLGIWALALLPITVILGRSSQFVRELTPFLMLLLSYEALQGVAGSLSLTPIIHATVSPTGVSYGFLQAFQSAFLSPDLTDIMTLVYGLHFPLVIVSAILLWYSNKTLYRRYVYALVACSYISLIFYVLAPSAPPWYNGVVSNLLANTSNQTGSSSLISSIARMGSMIESDKLAAFPSLHAAYAVLFGYFTIKLRRIYAIVSAPITASILFSTVYLGQHYVVDLLGGIAIAVACALLTARLIGRPARSGEMLLTRQSRGPV